MISYTFIIPHKNSYLLLKRCLKSIPQREDLEIIVIDDNSEDYEAVEAVVRKFSRASLYKNDGYGAGGARNTALKYAKGKWIVFSDADDYFVPGFIEVLDKYVNQDFDILYHPALAVDSDTLSPLPNMLSKHNRYFDEYNGDKRTTDFIKFRLHSPWWKMVRTVFIRKYDIRFEEVPKGNDVFFSYQIGYFSKKIAVEKTPIYVHTYNRSGITYGRKTVSIRMNSIIQSYKVNRFFDFINHPEWKRGALHIFYEIIKYDGIGLCLKTFFSFLTNYSVIKKNRNDYVDIIKNRKTND